jgi:hypothetical protein
VCSAVVVGIDICFKDLLDAGCREALQSDDEHVTVRRCVLFLIPFLLPPLIPHGR